MIVQPLIEEIADSGEYSLILFDGEFSHSVVKRAEARRFPGAARIMAASLSAATRRRARSSWPRPALAAAPARGDLCTGRHRRRTTMACCRIIELELIEPALFLDHAPDAGPRFAGAILSAASRANNHWRIADVRFGGRLASSRATSIFATSALIGSPRSRAAASSARQNIGSRLIEV